ncbi:MAG: radical SAM protein [Parcubacteria group bacterium]|nr:B12-binding domain-containing radical SAM protein [Patescibacteria group bacterium]
MNSDKKRILFVIPPYFSINDYTGSSIMTALPAFTIPYGILSIDAFIKGNVRNIKVETCLLDLNIEALKIIKQRRKYNDTDLLNILKDKVCEYQPNIVGISALFNTSYNYFAPISTIVKEQVDSAWVVAGGGLPTNLYKKILEECPHIDAVCYGEGEISMRDLVNAADHEKLIEKHQSWISRETIGKVPINSLVDDLDDIPEFDYSLVSLNDYNARSLDKSYSAQEGKREMSIHTSRGCPFNCIFCANRKLHGKKVRFMSVEKVITEVKNMISNFGLTVLIIEDDHFLADKKRAKRILEQLSRFGIRIEFPNGLAVYAIDEEIGQLLKKAGVTLVSLAIESGSDYVLQKIIDKPLKVDMIKPKVKILRKNGLQVLAFIVLGLPGEMYEHRLETLNMLKDVGFDWVHISIAIPVVGSRLYDLCIDNNYIVNNDMRNHMISKANIKAPGVDPTDIEDFAYKLNLSANFVNNFNMSQGEYKKAAISFKNVAQKYPEHAFAHYFLSKAYDCMNYDNELVRKHMMAFTHSVENNEMWKKYANYFKLA